MTLRLKLTVIVWLILTTCSVERDRLVENDFDTYLNSLETLELPIYFDSKNGIHFGASENYDSALFRKYGFRWAESPLGKVFLGDSIVVLFDLVVGDNVSPMITTFDRAGNKLDSIKPLNGGGLDMNMDFDDYGMFDNREITVIDSARIWDINSDGTDRVEGTDRLVIDTIVYKIDFNGRFGKVKR